MKSNEEHRYICNFLFAAFQAIILFVACQTEQAHLKNINPISIKRVKVIRCQTADLLNRIQWSHKTFCLKQMKKCSTNRQTISPSIIEMQHRDIKSKTFIEPS